MTRTELEAKMGRVLWVIRENEKELDHVIRQIHALDKEGQNEKDSNDPSDG